MIKEILQYISYTYVDVQFILIVGFEFFKIEYVGAAIFGPIDLHHKRVEIQ